MLAGFLLLALLTLPGGVMAASDSTEENPDSAKVGRQNAQGSTVPDPGFQQSRNLVGHGGPVHAIQLNDDKTRVLTGSLDYAMMLWDVSGETPKELMRFDEHDGWVKALTFLPGEKRALSAAGGKVWLWDLTTGELIHVFEGHAAEVSALALSPDGRWAASSGTDRTIRLWELQTLTSGPVMTGHRGPVTDVAFSEDGSTVYSASADGTVRSWERSTGEFKRVLYDHGFGVYAMRRLPGGELLALGALNGKALIIDVRTGGRVHEFESINGPFLEIAVQEKPGLLAFSGSQKVGRNVVGIIRVFRIGDWAPIEEYEDPRGPIWAMDFGRFGSTLYYGGKDDYVTVWQVRPRKPFESVAGPTPRRFEVTKAKDVGELYFARTCSICHTLSSAGRNRAGPTLYKVFGRKAGSIPGYPYSDALKDSDIVWNEETLSLLFGLGPNHYTPGTKMPLQKIADQKTLKALIAYLKVATEGGDPDAQEGSARQKTVN
jgi:cytochrome c